jgi:alcohol dehydrogenase (cytochrome c)
LQLSRVRLISRRLQAAAAIAGLIVAASIAYASRSHLIQTAAILVNYWRSWDAPAGTLTIESSPTAATPIPPAFAPLEQDADSGSSEWPSYNRNLTSTRYSPLNQIDRSNVGALRVLCTYDTKQFSSFQTGPIVVHGVLIGTSEFNTFAIDPTTCKERWRIHEKFTTGAVNRGVAYWDGLLYRGTGDGRVLAYDLNTGEQVWQSTISNPKLGESVPSAPIVWNGLVFIGNGGGDRKGVKGRVYALNAKTGKIVWEFYLVPKGNADTARGPQGLSPLNLATWGNNAQTPITGGANWTSYTLDPLTGELYVPAGNSAPDFASAPRKGLNLFSGSVVVLDAMTGAYKRHFELTSGDWHDWDVSNTPAIIRTQGGKRIMAVAPKDGRLYGYNLDSNEQIYKIAVDRIENADVPFSTNKAVHFCPGGRGGAEWNGPAYDPQTNLIFIGEVDWCSTVIVQTDAQITATKLGRIWAAMASRNPYSTFGAQDSYRHWAGWLYAADADSGAWRWRAESNYPIQGGVTTTAGRVVFFGDMGGNFYALDTASGRILLRINLGGAIGGGVVTYSIGGVQKVAVATGFTSILWPTKIETGKIVILGLPGG